MLTFSILIIIFFFFYLLFYLSFFNFFFFFFNDTATTEIYTLSLHDALPIASRHRILEPAWVKDSQGDRNAEMEEAELAIWADSAAAASNGGSCNRVRRLRPDRTCTSTVCEFSAAAAAAGLQSVDSLYCAATELQTDFADDTKCGRRRFPDLSVNRYGSPLSEGTSPATAPG